MQQDENILDLEKYREAVAGSHLTLDSGKVIEVRGLLIKGYLPGASVGSLVEIFPSGTDDSFFAEVIGFKEQAVLMMPIGEMRGVGLGSRIQLVKQLATVKVSSEMLGRVLDGVGQPIDQKGPVEGARDVPLYKEVRNPLARKPIQTPLDLGVRAINGFLSVGEGQRVSIMAGSGVGKSVLLGMMARYAKADVNVIALIGERGRELREFIEQDLGPEGLKKSVIVVATSDQGPLVRMRGAYTAMAISEFFCSQGKNVLLMMDSVTRFAMAQREVGLSMGEPPTSKGYTPSVFSLLPKLLERAGSFEGEGSITGLFTVLVEGDDMNDPIGDTVRSIVDGHIVLSRKLAQRGHFPSIDVLQSASRVMKNVTDRQHQKFALEGRQLLATYQDTEDLINIGAYRPGANSQIDRAVRLHEDLDKFLKQSIDEKDDFEQSIRALGQILGR